VEETSMNIAYTFVEGNLVKDPEMRTIGDNQKVTTLNLAVNHDKKGDSVSFFTIETWGKNAEACKNFLKKGSRIIVVGKLRQDRWTDDKGEVHSRIKIIAEEVKFTFGRKKTEKKEAA